MCNLVCDLHKLKRKIAQVVVTQPVFCSKAWVERFLLLPLHHESFLHCSYRTACEGGSVVRLDHFLLTPLVKHWGLYSSMSVTHCAIVVREAVNVVTGISDWGEWELLKLVLLPHKNVSRKLVGIFFSLKIALKIFLHCKLLLTVTSASILWQYSFPS